MKFIVTGGAGFIGSNLVNKLAAKHTVVVIDNLSREGSKKNLDWLLSGPNKGNISFINHDITKDFNNLKKIFGEGVDCVYHLAAQVAVTTSVANPRHDFEINALGTFNILEAIRTSKNKPFLLYSSTNKVYGGMEKTNVVREKTRYAYRDYKNGINESFPIDFHSPYGCSKGAADQYVRDYSRIYGLQTVVFRQSCIYGPRQFGVEDQGWVAWFIIAILTGKPITIYGDGRQVRDLLYVDDLINAYLKAFEYRNVTSGQIYNIGGGHKFTISVWKEFRPILERAFGKTIKAKAGNWRPGDQKIYVSDIGKARKDFKWKPIISPEDGINKLVVWAKKHSHLFS